MRPSPKYFAYQRSIHSLRRSSSFALAAVNWNSKPLECLEGRKWLLRSPSTAAKTVCLNDATSFKILQDDLLHPVLGGNKLRKLDAVIPYIVEMGMTDVSAHTAAVANACSECGIRAHLLVRGERPRIPSGYHLLARMFGYVTYISRSDYSDRDAMFKAYCDALTAREPKAKVFLLPEGGSGTLALLGSIRLVDWLKANCLDPNSKVSLVVDSGTGTTAVGLAVGIAALQLPWTVVGVMLAGSTAFYEQQAVDLCEAFQRDHPGMELKLEWVERLKPRSFGKVFDGEIATCAQIARQHGILIDPIYSLAAWEVAGDLARKEAVRPRSEDCHVVMLHTGGGLGLHGLAQRFPDQF